MKQPLIVVAAVVLSVSGCKEDTGKGADAKPATKPDTTSQAAAGFAELGPCYKYMHCQADSEINYSGLPKSECSAKGGKSWKGTRSGCTEL